MSDSTRYDVAVIGAGILGTAVARELLRRRPGARVLLVEREATLAAHQSSHNSGVIHAGVYYAPGSLKARLCVAGAELMYRFCGETGVPVERIGKLIVAASEAERAPLDELERRARANGVPGLRRLGPEEIRELEPHVTGVAALLSPNTGIVDFAAVCRALAAEVEERGGELRLGWPIRTLHDAGGEVTLVGEDGAALRAAQVVSCAGLWADRLAQRAGASTDPRIVPFRGAYLRLRAERRHLVHRLIYPVPDPALPFLGVHLTPRIDGEVLVGPTALLVGARDAYRLSRLRGRDLLDTLTWPGSWRLARRWWRTGLGEIRLAARPRDFAAAAARYVPELRPDDLEPAWAGVRAQAVGRDGRLLDDFAVSRTGRTLHVRNAPSPAATSSLALAGLIVDELG